MNRDTWGKPDPKPERAAPKAPKPLRRVPVQRYSEKQVNITQRLNEVYEMMDEQARGMGGYILCAADPSRCSDSYIIDHSHTISRARCHKLGKPELIYDPENIEHCSREAHEEWDNYDPAFLKHANFQKRMAFIKLHDPYDFDRRMEIWAAANKPKETV